MVRKYHISGVWFYIVGMAAIVALYFFMCEAQKCDKDGCNRKSVENSNYCELHCSKPAEAILDSYNSSAKKREEQKEEKPSYEECNIVTCHKARIEKTLYCYEHACGIYGKDIIDDLQSGEITVKEAHDRDNRNKGVSGKKTDPYDVYDYDDPDDFADDWAEEFDDDYDDGYDDAYDYWEDAN